LEVLQRFDLFRSIHAFERCVRCNGSLEAIEKEKIQDRLLPGTRQHFEEFRICPACYQIYWKGSHHERMQQFIQEVAQGDCA
jgi:uncharacterized protein with PIN domain